MLKISIGPSLATCARDVIEKRLLPEHLFTT